MSQIWGSVATQRTSNFWEPIFKIDFKNLGFAKSSTVFDARYNFNVLKADEYIYTWN